MDVVTKSVGVRRIVILSIAAMCESGCMFTFQGNGPRSRQAVEHELPSATLEQLEQWKQEALEPWLFFGKRSTRGFGQLANYTGHYNTSFPWHLFVGPNRTTRYLEPPENDKKTKRAIVQRDKGWGVLFPLWSTYKSYTYDCETGQCLEVSQGGLITVFIGFFEDTRPHKTSHFSDKRVAIDELKYNERKLVFLALGALGGGRTNGRAYVSILWIPVPLWSTE